MEKCVIQWRKIGFERAYWLHKVYKSSPLESCSKSFCLDIGEEINALSRFNTDNGPGDKWFWNLKERHNLTNRKPCNVDHGRLRMVNTTVWKQHFDLLEAAIDKLGLRHKPNATFNCDVSIVARDRRSRKVVVSRRTKHSYSEGKGTRDYITLNACMSASWVILLSHIIFSQAHPFGPLS